MKTLQLIGIENNKGEIMLDTAYIDYSLNTLVYLMKDKYEDNAVEAMAGLLSTLITDDQLKVLIDSLSK